MRLSYYNMKAIKKLKFLYPIFTIILKMDKLMITELLKKDNIIIKNENTYLQRQTILFM